ncbi:MAG: hypothetical protein Q4C53_09055 [Clostridia bacterium]|nr:hypothetical protein [Clostridia bacterium]
MNDRDTLLELYEIVSGQANKLGLVRTIPALRYIRSMFGLGYDVYFRRRLAVCRMLIDLDVTVFSTPLDILTAVTLSHYLPVDHVPSGYAETLAELFADEPKVGEILSVLRQTDYNDKDYYEHLIKKRCALLIRICERGVLVETLYEWPTPVARRFIRETREDFVPICLYAMEHYREMRGPLAILLEKIKNLLACYEALIAHYDVQEVALLNETLALREENASLRAMILDLRAEAGEDIDEETDPCVCE